MSKFARLIGTTALGLVLAAGAANAEAKGKIAVRAFSAKGVDAAIASTLETSFCTALSEQGLEVMCPDEVRALVTAKQADLGLGNCESDDACLQAIAKMSEAARVVTGEVAKLGDVYIISVALIDPASGKVISRASEKTPKLEDLLDKLAPLAKKLAAAK